MIARFRRQLIASSLWASVFASHASAQDADALPIPHDPDAAAEASAGSLNLFGDSSFVAVPIPVSNPAIGSGGAAAGALLFKFDEVSSTSVIGTAGFYTQNGSWGAGGLASLAFDQDRYRLRAVGGYANVNYEFFGIGDNPAVQRSHVTLNQSGYVGHFSLEGRLAPNFYAGGKLRFMTISTNFPNANGGRLPNGAVSAPDSVVGSVGVVATYDTRDRDFAPAAGQLIEGEANFSAHDFRLQQNYLRLTASYSRYDSFSSDLVLASRASFCSIQGDAPIFDLCLFGSRNDIRGYPVGKFQDKAMMALQTELRWHAFWRIGFVAFAGLGSVASSAAKFKYLLAAAGGGIRFVASREYGLNVGIDGAINKDGEKTFYVQIGEAF